MKVTNNSGISTSLAVWLLADNYDHINEPNYISATSLMKPIRHIVLPSRAGASTRTPDVEDFIARAMGNSLHDSIEKAWVNNYRRSLHLLGYPDDMIEKVLVNPTDEELASTPGAIPVYLEQRAFKTIAGYTVGGKFDMVAEGIVHDNKSTSAYTWIYGGRDDEHQLQGSLYRWLNPTKITEDYIRINYIFTDWRKADARSNPKYPQKRVESKEIPLLSVKETEDWVRWKLAQIQKYSTLPEQEIPECTDEELWRSQTVYKYFSDPSKVGGRSTKNFDALADAKRFQIEKGGKGVIQTVMGEPKRCGYCDAYDVCSQRKRYFPE